MNVKEVRKKRNYKVGYYTQEELIDGSDYGGEDTWRRRAYTPGGQYLGNKRMAHLLCAKKGIDQFEKRTDTSTVCSIGFNSAEQKWYGWSHRAIYGYGIGDVVEEGSVPTESGWTEEYLAEHPEEDTTVPAGFKVETLEDAKRVAIAFAETVACMEQNGAPYRPGTPNSSDLKPMIVNTKDTAKLEF